MGPSDRKAYTELSEALKRITDTQYWCDECIAAAEVSQARSDGKPDPFPVYERTLTTNQWDRIEELYPHLTRQFPFTVAKFKAHYVYPCLHDEALLLEPGNYRQPLTVIVYYVVTRDEQDRIVTLVSEFLSGQELHQARVQFWEAEVWETGENPETDLSGGWRGRETLLREVFLNCENEKMQLQHLVTTNAD